MGSCISIHTPLDLKLDFDISKAKAGPISRLPDSILYLIFVDVADAEPIYDLHGFASRRLGNSNPSYYDCLGWTRLSAVCRRWRVILLGTASLWAECVFGLPSNMATLALTRSGTAPLTMAIPQYENMAPAWQQEVMKRKKWGLPHTHRDRLLNLASTQSHRIKAFLARDLSSQHYHSIFQNGPFYSLTFLALSYEYNDSGPSAPSREDLDDLHIVAPHVRKAGFAPTLPIAHDGKPGLHIILPALRHLEISADLKVQSTVPKSVDQLHWIPSLICGAPALEHIEIILAVDDLEVNWAQLFGGKCGQLSALRYLRVVGLPKVHLDELSNLIASDVPMNVNIELVLTETDTLNTLEAYISMLGRSIHLHSLDSVYLSRGLLMTQSGGPLASLYMNTCPSTELLHSKITPEAYLCCPSNQSTNAGLLVASLSHSLEPHEDPRDSSGDMLNLLIPVLIHKGINTLILDEVSTGQWAIAFTSDRQGLYKSMPTGIGT
ncbi:hypothetical protein PENSPDRAFT_690263 [Peniophora sp. CONT]|nr:hypothetical protein PENSPDRAFT_690263 [Peniophora sp. CONT]